MPKTLVLFGFLFVESVANFESVADGKGAEDDIFFFQEAYTSPPPPFGHALRDFFALDKNYTNLNHGSYGSPPLSVLEAERAWELRMESNPDRWFRYDMYKILDAARRIVSEYVSADADEVVFVPNASHGVNAVLRSLKIPKDKKILYMSSAYGMVKNTLKYLHDFDEAQLLRVDISTPISPQAILSAVSAALESNPNSVYIASISHIVSVPGMILPVAELVEMLHSHGAMVLVDGAHALGQIPVNLTSLNADFWVGNGHKWLYSPKGSAILWVRRDRQALVEPTTISWEGRGNSHFQKAFSYVGTKSVSPYLAMASAIRFRTWLGGEEKVMSYMHTLAREAGQVLSRMFRTGLIVPEDMSASMVDVQLPTSNKTTGTAIPTQLLERFGTWIPVYTLADANKPDVIAIRVSCQVYNSIDDVKMAGNAILQIIRELEGDSKLI